MHNIKIAFYGVFVKVFEGIVVSFWRFLRFLVVFAEFFAKMGKKIPTNQTISV